MYKTPTVPELTLDIAQDEDEWVVTLSGDHIKELYRGMDEAKAKEVYDGVKYDYEVNYPK